DADQRVFGVGGGVDHRDGDDRQTDNRSPDADPAPGRLLGYEPPASAHGDHETDQHEHEIGGVAEGEDDHPHRPYHPADDRQPRQHAAAPGYGTMRFRAHYKASYGCGAGSAVKGPAGTFRSVVERDPAVRGTGSSARSRVEPGDYCRESRRSWGTG